MKSGRNDGPLLAETPGSIDLLRDAEAARLQMEEGTRAAQLRPRLAAWREVRETRAFNEEARVIVVVAGLGIPPKPSLGQPVS